MRTVTAAVVAVLLVVAPLHAGSFDNWDKEQNEVQTVVKRFLKRLGDRRFDALVHDFVPWTVIMLTSQTDNGQFIMSVTTASEWLQVVRKDKNSTPFRRPIINLEISVPYGERCAYL